MKANEVRLETREPDDPPQVDAIGTSRSIYEAHYSRADAPRGDLFIGIVVQAWDTAEHAQATHNLFAAVPSYVRVPETNLLTHKLVQPGYTRREVWGRVGRYEYNFFETEPKGTADICDDAALLRIAGIIEGRLP